MMGVQLMRTARDLAAFIDRHDIAAEILFLEVETPTVEAAAQALGVQPAQIIKSVLFLADKEPVVVIASGTVRLDRKALADHLGVSRRRVKIAGPEQVLAHTGYVAGSVPPFGYVQPIHTLIETAVTQLTHAHIFGGGGDVNALMKLTVSELRRVVGLETARLSVIGER